VSARTADPLLGEVKALFTPVIAPAAEKADLLIAHMCEHNGAPSFEARGLAQAVKRLRKHFSDEQISAAARSLIERLERDYCCREPVK
jgi:hypothetical protein